MSLADRLTSTNLAYRRPDLYDYLGNDGDGLIGVVNQLTDSVGPASVLDLGCGTGRQLAALQEAFGCEGVGVDVQPGLIEYAQATYPQLDLRLDDIRSVRLNRQFDLVLCLGNSLSYQLIDTDLQATAETFAAHTRPGGHVLIDTVMHPSQGAGTSEIANELVTAAIEFDSTWDPHRRIVTTKRVWRHQDGHTDEDTMQRRVTPINELADLLTAVAFTEIDLQGSLVVARKSSTTARQSTS